MKKNQCHGLVLPWSLHGEDEHKSVFFWSNRYRAHHDVVRKYDDSDHVELEMYCYDIDPSSI